MYMDVVLIIRGAADK